MTKRIEFRRGLFEQPRDTKTLRNGSRSKQAVINIQEKKTELRKVLYSIAKETRTKRKSMANEEIIKTLSIQSRIYEKYPLTGPTEAELIANGLAGKAKQL